MPKSIQPFLMFQGEASEAIAFYTGLFPDGRVEEMHLYKPGQEFAPGQAAPEGSVMRARFTVAGQSVMAIDSPVEHDFTFSPAMSLFVECSDMAEIERLWVALAAGGTVHMPLGSYGFSTQFAWVADRFGVSWQLNLT